jgi:aspartate carbamoyltransferase catalytic subunit
MVGDLANGRTVRSLATLLTRYSGVEIHFVAPPEVAMKADVKRYLDEHAVAWTETTDLEPVLKTADVVYQTRVQKERFADEQSYRAVRGRYRIDAGVMSHIRADAVLMHPLPRVDEIDPAVDADPRAAYFRQARNGVYVRMALLEMVLR